MIASAMICEPKLLIADEPTTALDVTIQLQIVKLLQRLNKEKNTAILFISHAQWQHGGKWQNRRYFSKSPKRVYKGANQCDSKIGKVKG